MNYFNRENLAAYIVAIVVVMLLSFLATGGIVWVVCWAFHWTFRWSLVIAIWLLWLVARGVFNRG